MINRGIVPVSWVTVVLVAISIAACGPSPLPPAGEGSAAPSSADTYVYRCESDYRFSVAVSPARAVLRVDGEERVLPNVVSASGARYAGGGVTFWSSGLEALFETPAVTYRDCIGQQAMTEADEARLLSGEGAGGIELEHAEWSLMSIAGLPAVPSEGGALPQLHFAEGRITGFTGCNRLVGDYVRAEGEGLSFREPLGTTRMACSAPYLADQETRLLDALGRVDGYFTWGDVLTLLDGDEVAARFTTVGSANEAG